MFHMGATFFEGFNPIFILENPNDSFCRKFPEATNPIPNSWGNYPGFLMVKSIISGEVAPEVAFDSRLTKAAPSRKTPYCAK